MKEYTLKNPFLNTSQGEDTNITDILIPAPNANCRTACFQIKSQYDKAVSNYQEKAIRMSEGFDQATLDKASEYVKEKKATEEDKTTKTENDAKEIIEILSMGGGDLNACTNALFVLLKQSKAKYNGEFLANDGLNEGMSFMELDSLLGFYMANFIVAS